METDAFNTTSNLLMPKLGKRLIKGDKSYGYTSQFPLVFSFTSKKERNKFFFFFLNLFVQNKMGPSFSTPILVCF